jgi:hypothetical protein
MGLVSQAELLSRVRELRAAGLSPKQVARELGMKPAQVAPLIRQVAGSHRGPAEQRSLGEPGEREVVGCWINPGWSAGLGLDQAPPEWATADPEGQRVGDTLAGGLATVMVARADRSSRVTVCGWLVDVFCLGVKNAMGPKTMSSSALFDHSRLFFSAFDTPPRTIPVQLAQQLVHGAVAYARSFGFEPHPDFAATVPYLGPAPDTCPIRFGRDGMPLYVSGPRDNPRAVIAALEATAGRGNYHYITHL